MSASNDNREAASEIAKRRREEKTRVTKSHSAGLKVSRKAVQVQKDVQKRAAESTPPDTGKKGKGK